MSIIEKLESAINSRDDIQQSINDMGVTVDNTVPLSQYSSKILQIQSGSSITPGIQLWGNDFDGTTSIIGDITLGNSSIIGSPLNLTSVSGYALQILSDNIVTEESRLQFPQSVLIPYDTNVEKFVVTFQDFDVQNISGTSPFYLRPSSGIGYFVNIRPDWISDQISNSSTITDAISAHDSNSESHNNIQSRVDSLESSVENKSNKVDISSTATVDQYPNAKSVWDLVQDVIANIPAGGLKVPQSIPLESGLPDIVTRQIGDYFYIQNMDITMEGHTGRAWVNLTDTGNPSSELRYYKVYDQYQSMDGTSITQTGGGEWGVSLSWLQNIINAAVSNKVDKITISNALYTTNTTEYIRYSNTVDANRIVQRNNAGNIAVRGDISLTSDLAIGAAQISSLIPKKGTTYPLANGDATAGSSDNYAPIDHVHPIQNLQKFTDVTALSQILSPNSPNAYLFPTTPGDFSLDINQDFSDKLEGIREYKIIVKCDFISSISLLTNADIDVINSLAGSYIDTNSIRLVVINLTDIYQYHGANRIRIIDINTYPNII